MDNQNDDALTATAVGVAEDAKAARAKPAKAQKAEPVTRVDLKTHMVEELVEGDGQSDDSVWKELRTATPEELAAERDRQADFSDDESGSSSVTDRLEEFASDYVVDQKSLVADLRDAMLETAKRLDKPWSVTPFDQQRDIAAAVEHVATELVRKVVEAVAADPARQPIRCLLVGYADKGDDIKVDLKVKALGEDETSAAVLQLHKAKGKHVMVTVASVDDYRQVDREAELQPDQPALGFEAGSDHPEDDSDLAGEGGDD